MYSVDIVMPDEMMLATEDVINNRDDKGFGSHAKDIPKKLANDAYSIMSATAYCHFQDISRITKDLWEDEAYEPDSFEYNAEGLQDVYDLANDFSDDKPWLREACNNHDRCYFTEGTSSKECNAQCIVEAVDSCNHISGLDILLFMAQKMLFADLKV